MVFSLSHFYITIVIISFLCSLLSFRLHYPFHLKLFSVFLGITVIIEICANFLLGFLKLQTNFPVYNTFMLIEYPLLAFYFRQIISAAITKKVINIFLFGFPLFWFITIFFIFGISGWNSYAIMFGDVFIIIISARYLYELFTSNELINFRSCAEFWVAVALIFYSSCELPITGILNFWVRNNPAITLQLYNVLQILNIIMYSVLIYAFLCPIKTQHTKY